jgi:2-polyprenyl-3-methyl-5-hydroxy-6-metoxy-1,4-benzoquinol methylase
MTTFERYYDAAWAPRDPYFVHHRTRFLQTWQAVEALRLPAGARVLDVGGVGPLAAHLAAAGHPVEGTSVDLRGPLPLADDSFDLVLCTETLEHMKDQESAAVRDLEAFNFSGVRHLLREMRRCLKPGGRLVVTTPNGASWHMLAKWLQGDVLLADPRHVREFTTQELARLAAGCGLRVLSMRTIESWSLGRSPQLETLAAVVQQLAVPPVPREDNILAVFAPA